MVIENIIILENNGKPMEAVAEYENMLCQKNLDLMGIIRAGVLCLHLSEGGSLFRLGFRQGSSEWERNEMKYRLLALNYIQLGLSMFPQESLSNFWWGYLNTIFPGFKIGCSYETGFKHLTIATMLPAPVPFSFGVLAGYYLDLKHNLKIKRNPAIAYSLLIKQLALAPESPAPHVVIAMVLHSLGRHDDAKKELGIAQICKDYILLSTDGEYERFVYKNFSKKWEDIKEDLPVLMNWCERCLDINVRKE